MGQLPNQGVFAALLASQARCPFQAFAAHRLIAKPAPMPSEAGGLDALDRGQILHRIMETIWSKLKKQSTLVSMPSSCLDELITEDIHQALQPYRKTRPHSLTPLAQSIECDRLKQLVLVTLAWEKQRPPFEIEALEAVFTYSLDDIPFKVRIDRLDKLITDSAISEKVVIDYKTSLPRSRPWYDERPEAPQLLLYALLDKDIRQLLFIQLKNNHIKLSGFSEQTSTDHGVHSLKPKEQWTDYQEKWANELTHLAHEIKIGHCEPTQTKHCLHCDFKTLCRVQAPS